jgi:hypothetical protein
MGLFGPTVRDFSKSHEGRQCLEALFKYQAFPKPKLIPIKNNGVFSKNILGRTFEYLLLLLIERQNKDFDFEFPMKERLRGSKNKVARNIKHYFTYGELTENLLDTLTLLGEKKQKSFQLANSKSKRDPSNHFKVELRRIHELASILKWTIKDSFYEGWLTDGRMATAKADLIVDSKLIEVKTTEDGQKHDEHLSQLFSYFLLSQAPMRLLGAFTIDEVGVYYSRHGVLVQQNVAELVRFPLNRAAKNAFDFVVEFSRWRTKKTHGDDNWALREAVSELCPRPDWATQILSNPSRKISLPENFLLKKC